MRLNNKDDTNLGVVLLLHGSDLIGERDEEQARESIKRCSDEDQNEDCTQELCHELEHTISIPGTHIGKTLQLHGRS